MAKILSELPVGALVKDNATTYNGKTIVWRIVDKDHSGYPSGAITLMSDKILSLKCFDAMEPTSQDNGRRSYGNNRYAKSNITQWLAKASEWYMGQPGGDTPPMESTVWNGYNDYESENGFFSNFSSGMISMVKNTSLTVVRSVPADGGGYETTNYNKFFLASATELGLPNENGIAEGTRLAAFSSDASRQAYPTAECVRNSEYKEGALNTASPWRYWLRTPCSSDSYNVRSVSASGTLENNEAYSGRVGVRPLCNVGASTTISNAPDSEGIYTILFNQPPTAPNSITVPDGIRGGTSISIEWGTATDVDGNLSGYILERQVNNGAWAQIYSGSGRAYIDSITYGWVSVAYRVKAYDTSGEQSGYRTSAIRSILNNTAPTISGNDENLGMKSGAFNQPYTVTDIDYDQTIMVAENLDGKLYRNFRAISGQSNTFSVSETQWRELLNGVHTITITASDNFGEQTMRTYTFMKNETAVDFTLAAPIQANQIITKAILSIPRQIPAGAIFTVEACNNGYDAAPAWEDVTNAVVGNRKFFFSNGTKTASSWGFNLRVKVNRNNVSGDCYIISAGGNFE